MSSSLVRNIRWKVKNWLSLGNAAVSLKDKLHLILTMPQGGRALIPKEWTDLEALPPASPAQVNLRNNLLDSVRELLHARAIVDALLNRRNP